MDILRTEVSHLAEYDPDGNVFSEVANYRRATRLRAQVPMIVATIYRSRLGKSVPEPRKDFAENLPLHVQRRSPDKKEIDVLHRYMTLHADHGFNASTFAARVTASTNSDTYIQP